MARSVFERGAEDTWHTGNGVGLDRIDNAKGYEVGNVVPCCVNCNMERRTLSFAEYTAVWMVRRIVDGVDAARIRNVALSVSNGVRTGRLHHDRSARSRVAQHRPEPEWKQLLRDRSHRRECGLDPDAPIPVRLDGEADASYRERLGISQEQFSKLIGRSRRTVQRIEKDARNGLARRLNRPRAA